MTLIGGQSLPLSSMEVLASSCIRTFSSNGKGSRNPQSPVLSKVSVSSHSKIIRTFPSNEEGPRNTWKQTLQLSILLAWIRTGHHLVQTWLLHALAWEIRYNTTLWRPWHLMGKLNDQMRVIQHWDRNALVKWNRCSLLMESWILVKSIEWWNTLLPLKCNPILKFRMFYEQVTSFILTLN